MYSAQGSNASWDWLRTISPCITILRELVTNFHSALGSHQGSKHSSPDLSDDIEALMDSLESHGVYAHHNGRIIEDMKGNTSIVRDTLTTGLHQLSSPLKDYNELFKTLQARRRLRPLITEKWHALVFKTQQATDTLEIGRHGQQLSDAESENDAIMVVDEESSSSASVSVSSS